MVAVVAVVYGIFRNTNSTNRNTNTSTDANTLLVLLVLPIVILASAGRRYPREPGVRKPGDPNSEFPVRGIPGFLTAKRESRFQA